MVRNHSSPTSRAGEARHLLFVSTASLVLASAGLAAPAAAQTAPQVSPPTREELLPPEARQPDREGVTLTIDGEMERLPCALDRPEYQTIMVTLSTVRFTGAEKAPEVSLAPAYDEYLGRELPIAVLCDIRAQAAAILQGAGYLATVEIPEQRLSNGDAELRVVFGRLTALRVRGEAGPSEELVAGYLEKLVGQPVFNTYEAERYLLLADDLPGVDVRLSLRPAAGGAPGDLIGEIAVLRRRGTLDFNVQNLGSKAIGRFGALLRGEVYDLIGTGDRTSLALFSTLDFQEQQTVQIGHESRIGSEGLTIGGQFTYSWTEPDIGIPGFDLESETLFASLIAGYPLRRSREATILGDLGFDYVDQDVEVNAISLTRDRVRTAFARVGGEWIDRDSVARLGGYTQFEPRSRFGGSIEIRQGLDVFEASPDCRPSPLACVTGAAVPPSRIEADPTPLSFRFDALGEYRPVPNIAFVLRADGQFTNDPLPAFEEFAAGNYSIGRGYDPGVVLGDSGVGLSFEMRYGTLAPQTPESFALQPYLFTDAAWAWNEDPSRRPLNPDRLWSAGAGLRAAWGARMQADLSLAVPLERTDFQGSRGDVRVLFSITTRLLPWRY